MAQKVVQERPPDPVIHPTCEHCAKGDEPKRGNRYTPRVHVLAPEEDGRQGREVICPVHNHPLVVKQCWRMANWAQWRQLWDEATSYEQLAGLLHVGLDVPRNQCKWEEPILFYLALADGWKEGFSSYASDQTSVNLLKAKAWKTLAMHHWKLSDEDIWRRDQNWEGFLKPALVDPILDFFLRQDNLPRGSSAISENRTAYTFVEWLVEMLWQRSSSDELRHLMTDQSRREKVMRLLITMDHCGDLTNAVFGLTRRDRRFLKRFALKGTEAGTTLWRVSAGLTGGSISGRVGIARVLINSFIAKRECARIKRVKRVERKQEAEEQRQRELEAAKQELLETTKKIDRLLSK